MDFEDKTQKIYKHFCRDWISRNRTKVKKIIKKNPISWKTYISKKNLGIVVEQINHTDTFHYKVIDEKKWTLTKIKYGF